MTWEKTEPTIYENTEHSLQVEWSQNKGAFLVWVKGAPKSKIPLAVISDLLLTSNLIVVEVSKVADMHEKHRNFEYEQADLLRQLDHYRKELRTSKHDAKSMAEYSDMLKRNLKNAFEVIDNDTRAM